MKILLVNNNAQACGVHQYGENFYKFLATADDFEVHYSEIYGAVSPSETYERVKPDVLLVNYWPTWWHEVAPVMKLALRDDIIRGAIIHDDFPTGLPFTFCLRSDPDGLSIPRAPVTSSTTRE
jgi:hypothetical protein